MTNKPVFLSYIPYMQSFLRNFLTLLPSCFLLYTHVFGLILSRLNASVPCNSEHSSPKLECVSEKHLIELFWRHITSIEVNCCGVDI